MTSCLWSGIPLYLGWGETDSPGKSYTSLADQDLGLGLHSLCPKKFLQDSLCDLPRYQIYSGGGLLGAGGQDDLLSKHHNPKNITLQEGFSPTDPGLKPCKT